MANKNNASAPKKARKTLSEEEKKFRAEQRKHKNSIRSIFTNAGFSILSPEKEVHFEYDNVKTELDEILCLENVIVIAEYTVSKQSNVSDHIRKKDIFYRKLLADTDKFIDFMKETFPKFSDHFDKNIYQNTHYKIVILYCSKNGVDERLSKNINNIKYLKHKHYMYLKEVSSAIKRSSTGEILTYLGINASEFGKSVIATKTHSDATFTGSLLPATNSGFPSGYSVVSFYADAQSLLSHHYVLRRDGWRDGDSLYQRMLSKPKIDKMRKYLSKEERVYVNNVIATLPPDTKVENVTLADSSKSTIDKVRPVTVQFPEQFNCIGIIDGQHRILSYYDSGNDLPVIKKLRALQNLLVTGIVYPSHVTEIEKREFEAQLFLEINSTQSMPNPSLRQAINVILNPWDNASIAREVVTSLNDMSALENEFERYFYDRQKIKIASIASFGVAPLTKLSGNDSAFKSWDNANKDKLSEKSDLHLRKEYINYVAEIINNALIAVKKNVDQKYWTRSPKVPGRLLNTTMINGVISLIRNLIQNDHKIDRAYLESKLKGLSHEDFAGFKSSQYNKLGQRLYEKFFKPA